MKNRRTFLKVMAAAPPKTKLRPIIIKTAVEAVDAHTMGHTQGVANTDSLITRMAGTL